MKRHLAAILVADLVGFSRLMGEDESGTLKRLKNCIDTVFRPRIARHGGRIVKLLGDGVLAEFPSVASAVTCAVEMQDEFALRAAKNERETKFLFRIGVNLGDVIADGDDVYGDGVNIASRIEALAPAGEICITRPVRDQIRDKLEYHLEDLGDLNVKNIDRPVHVFRIVRDPKEVAKLTRASRRPGLSVRKIALFVLIFVGVLIVADQFRSPPQPDVSEPEFEVLERAGKVYPTRRSALRFGPVKSSVLVGYVKAGEALTVTGEVNDDGEIWYRIRLSNSDSDAFILGTLVTTAAPDATKAVTNGPDGGIAEPEGDLTIETPVTEENVAPAIASISFRITVDSTLPVYTACVSFGDNRVYTLALPTGSDWIPIDIQTGPDIDLVAKARQQGTSVVVELWPYSKVWLEKDVVIINLSEPGAGANAQAFSKRRARTPLDICGRLVFYLDIIEYTGGG